MLLRLPSDVDKELEFLWAAMKKENNDSDSSFGVASQFLNSFMQVRSSLRLI